MAYVFEREESIPIGIKRIFSELIDGILLQLNDKTNNRDKAIYYSRKSFKQLRALLKLWRQEAKKGFYQETNGFYRELALKLAPLRDAFVLVEALDKLLEGQEDTEILESGKALRKDLKKNHKAIRRDLLKEGGLVEEVSQQLAAHHPSIENWKLPRNKFKVFETELENGYQDGKTHLRLAYKTNNAEGFHEWRKAVKTLWHYCRLLEQCHPESLSPYIEALKKLSDTLGLANDFAILEAYLVNAEQLALVPLLQAKQAGLLADAKPLGKVIYQEDSRKFVKKIKQAWKKSA